VTPIIVAFPVFNRPALLERVLESWSRVRGVERASFQFHVEPGCQESAALCRAVGFAESTTLINPARLGHALNVLASMNTAFRHADYAIQALDDFVVSTDILELHDWHRARYEHDSSVLALTSGRDFAAMNPTPHEVWRCKLIGAVSGFHRGKWRMLAERWAEGGANWWAWVNQYWLQEGPYDVLFPALSRADDIGDYHPTTCFLPDPPPQSYEEVTWAREGGQGYMRTVEIRHARS
jgi:hypothetical protein